MANTLKSWMILNNATADIPAAGDTGAHQFDTTLLVPYYDDGSNNVPWRFNFGYPLVANHTAGGGSTNWTLPGGTGDNYGGANYTNVHRLNFSRFRQARIYGSCRNTVLSAGNVELIIYDITNAQAMTSSITFPNDGVWYRRPATLSSGWTNLNSATYGAPDCEFEIQVSNGTAGDSIDVGTIMLELR